MLRVSFFILKAHTRGGEATMKWCNLGDTWCSMEFWRTTEEAFSSLLKLISGITCPSSGKVTIDENTSIHEDLFYIGHKYGLKNELSVADNIKYTLGFHQRNLEEKYIIDELDLYNIKDKFITKVKYLSHGQKKIVTLVQLSLLKNKIWVLDEPFTGLDQNIIDTFIKKIDQHIADGGTVVITSHNQKDKFTNVEL